MDNQVVERVNVFDFSDKELVGRNETETKAFAEILLANGRVFVPVLATTLNNKPVVLDGVKRIMACRYIVDNELGQTENFETVPTIFEDKLDPKERAVITISANEHRSDNEIAAYLKMKELIKKKKWIEYAAMYKFNKQTFKKLSKLDDLIEQDYFFEQFKENNVAMTTLFAIAKQGAPRQKICLAKLKAGQKVTGHDLREIRSVQTNKVLAGLDLNLNVPTVERHKDLFIYVDGKKTSPIFETVVDAVGANEKGVLYRLVPMGSK